MDLTPQEKIAKILRTDHDYIYDIERQLSAKTGKTKVLEAIMDENEALINDRLFKIGASRSATVKEVYDALILKIEADDHKLFQALGSPDCKKIEDCRRVAEAARQAANPPKGFFLKLDKAKEFLTKQPPLEVLKFLGYSTAEEMLAKEDIYEVMSGLRFIEKSEWLNNVFFKQYAALTPDDFEERDIQVRVLSEKWMEGTKRFTINIFLEKKKHNVSHLKELGVVFVIPSLLGISGEILRMFAMILHYLHEVHFYSDIFRDIAKDSTTFTDNFQSLLRGDVIDRHVLRDDDPFWLVVQRYLAKEDDYDWRLFVPHINPEALHWVNVEKSLTDAGFKLGEFQEDLGFWRNLDWVGDFFKNEDGDEVLMSFDLVDTVMSLVKEKEMVKYLYHHQEALWNKIFTAYMGEGAVLEYSKKYLLQGYFEM